MYLEKVRINFERLVVLLDGLVKVARVVEHPSQVGVYDQRQGVKFLGFFDLCVDGFFEPSHER